MNYKIEKGVVLYDEDTILETLLDMYIGDSVLVKSDMEREKFYQVSIRNGMKTVARYRKNQTWRVWRVS